jgi:hypothetical protein
MYLGNLSARLRVDYTTGFEAVEELRKPVPLGVSMSQFVLRWIHGISPLT